MGYNLSVGCHHCQVHASSLRGEEAFLIRWFGAWHGKVVHAMHGPDVCRADWRRHHVEVLVDNGFSQPRGEFPRDYRDVTHEVAQFAEIDRAWHSSLFYNVDLAPDGQFRATYDDGELRHTAVAETLTSALIAVASMVDSRALLC